MLRCKRCWIGDALEAHNCAENLYVQICPPLYRQTDPAKLNQELFKKVMEWEYSAKGLMLVGPSGTGKTRMAWQVVRRELENKKKVKYFDSVAFGHECARAFKEEDGGEWIDKLARRDLLFFDDLDKGKFTERVEAELFGLVERRISYCRPLLVTSQVGGEEFLKKFAQPARGLGILRRLKEFCTIVGCS